jgi:ATP-dependent Clp protease ATP-binding subunit ClpA
MFDSFSRRATEVVFAARFKAGERGANMIDIDDLLVGLVLEDQGTLEKTILPTIFEGRGTATAPKTRVPFFSSEVAEGLLSILDKKLAQSQPAALTAELPLTRSLERAFASAKAVQSQFRHNQIEPLHLLAAILTEEPSQGVKFLQSSGITREKVLLALSRGAGN